MRVRAKNPQCGPRLQVCDPSPAATYAALIVVCEPLLILHCLRCHQTLFIRSYLPLFFPWLSFTGVSSSTSVSVGRMHARHRRLEISWQSGRETDIKRRRRRKKKRQQLWHWRVCIWQSPLSVLSGQTETWSLLLILAGNSIVGNIQYTKRSCNTVWYPH